MFSSNLSSTGDEIEIQTFMEQRKVEVGRNEKWVIETQNELTLIAFLGTTGIECVMEGGKDPNDFFLSFSTRLITFVWDSDGKNRAGS